MKNISSKLLTIMIAFVLTVVGPFTTISAETEMLNRRLLLEDVCYFIDSVVDSREISESMLKEFNTSIAAYGINVNYDITIYHRAVSATSNEGYVVTFISDDDFSDLKQGDKISVHFYTSGHSVTNNLAGRLTGLFVGGLDETITARIR